MNSQDLYSRFQELQEYAGWTEKDAQAIQSIAALLDPFLPGLIDDFYNEIQKHPNARKVITGGQQQIQRLKGTLLRWIRELLSGPYDEGYVERRWKVGFRHVEIGLDQVYTNMALSRLRRGLCASLQAVWQGSVADLLALRQSLNTALDLDLAIIEDAYQSEYLAREQRVERLAAIGQVAGGIAHELRNPLNVVKTSVYYLVNARNPVPAKVNEHLQRIERHVTSADNVITALSNFARLPVPTVAPFSLSECIRETLESTELPAKIEVTFDCPASLPSVLADQEQVRIVLGNIIRNARDAMPEGGVLTFQARPLMEWVEISVTDNGVGISPENMHRIMEPLYSTKARGLGLGLALARAILEKNRGSLRVTSELGKGSTFTLRLLAAGQQDL